MPFIHNNIAHFIYKRKRQNIVTHITQPILQYYNVIWCWLINNHIRHLCVVFRSAIQTKNKDILPKLKNNLSFPELISVKTISNSGYNILNSASKWIKTSSWRLFAWVLLLFPIEYSIVFRNPIVKLLEMGTWSEISSTNLSNLLESKDSAFGKRNNYNVAMCLYYSTIYTVIDISNISCHRYVVWYWYIILS